MKEVKMRRTADRNGNITEEHTLQDALLERLYGTMAGRLLLKPLVTPMVSRLGGRLLDSRISVLLIGPFIRKNFIDMSDYEKRSYRSYNDFFQWRLRPGVRRIDMTPDHLISPCDARLSVYSLDEEFAFTVKHTFYTVETLLKNRRLADRFCGGFAWIFRLCVDDYHRYIYIDNGKASPPRHIPGVFHTVNPIANDRYPIYKENTREYTLLRSKNFGTVLQMEVGALLVGKIENYIPTAPVVRGQEKGSFAFGGSTVILLTQKGKVRPDPDLLENTLQGIETRVLLGESIGFK